MEEQLYIRLRGEVQGPYTVEKLHELAKRQRFSKVHMVSTDGVKWEPATKYRDGVLFPASKVALPPVEQQHGTGDLELSEPEDPLFGGISDPAVPGGVNAEESLWYYTRGAEEVGPVQMSDLKQLVSSGELTGSDMLWASGMDDWIEADQLPELFPSEPTSESPFDSAGRSAVRTSTLAVVSLLAATLGFCLPILGPLGAVVCGHLALNEIRSSGGLVGGRGVALGGLILGYAGVAVSLLVLVASIVVMALGSGG